MASSLLYHTFTFLSLFSYGLHHLLSSTRSFLKPSSPSPYSARPFPPLPLPSPLHLLPLPLSLLLSLSLHLSHPSLPSLLSSLPLLLFLLLSLLPLPSDLTFLLSSLSFSLLSSLPSSFHPSDLQSKCHSLSSLISASSAAFSLALAISPRLFLSEFALAASLCLQGLWSLQTGLFVNVERFVPEGCHRLLEVRDGAVRCELEESRARAGMILELAFGIYVVVVAVVAVGVYVGVGWRRGNGGGAYEALPTSSSGNGRVGELEHVQMRAMGKSEMQA